MDQQFFRKSKEATICFAAKAGESGDFTVLEQHRLTGRTRVVARGLEQLEAARLRNTLIRNS